MGCQIQCDYLFQFCFLILYPFYCLCLTKSSHSSSKEPLFVEEYLFSRLFFHMLFLHKDNEICFFDGIIYTSTIDRNAYNIVLPARYSVPENDDHNVESPFLRNRLMNIGPPFPIDSVPKEWRLQTIKPLSSSAAILRGRKWRRVLRGQIEKDRRYCPILILYFIYFGISFSTGSPGSLSSMISGSSL